MYNRNIEPNLSHRQSCDIMRTKEANFNSVSSGIGRHDGHAHRTIMRFWTISFPR